MGYNKDGINEETYNLLFGCNFGYRKVDKDERNRSFVYLIIDAFTKSREKQTFSDLLRKIGDEYIDDLAKIAWIEEKKEYEYNVFGKKYTFSKISEMINLEKQKEELETSERYKKCHFATLNMAISDKDDIVITGYRNIFGDQNVLHSVIETKEGKIIDWTMNIVMTKEQYMELMGFKVIERLSNDDVIEILLKFPKLNGLMAVNVASVFGKELLKDMEKRNPGFLANDEEMEKEIERIKKKYKQVERD